VNIIDRYIGKNVLIATMLALLLLIGLQSFISFIGELHYIGTKDYGVLQALQYVPMQLPTALYQYFPIAALLGVLMGLGRLASQSELIVLRASGMSLTRIIIAVLKTMIIALVFMTIVGEWIAPRLAHEGDVRKIIAMSGGQTLGVGQGIWVRDGNNFIYINHVLPQGHLQDVTRYKFQNYQLIRASHAVSAVYQNAQWHFSQVEQSDLSARKVTSQFFPEQTWKVTFKPDLLRFAAVDSTKLSLGRLFRYMRYLQENHQTADKVEFQFWQRVFQPLATLIMFCLGVPFVFGPLRNATMGLRIVTGVCIGFGFYTLNQFFGPISMVYQLPPLLAAGLPLVLFALGGGILLWSAR
jgi:lipopolysaccharide export system permease protein